MDNKMIMKEFQTYMGSKHRQINGWIITWITSVLFLITAGNKVAPAVETLYLAGAILFVLAGVHAYVRKYTRFYFAEKNNNMSYGLLVHTDLEDVIRSLGFDTYAYYYILGKRLLPMQIVSTAVCLIAGVLRFITLKYVLFLSAMYIVIPWCFLLLKAFDLQCYLTHACGYGRRFLTGAFGVLGDLCRICMMGIAFAFLALHVMGMLGTDRLMAGVDEQEIVKFGCNGGLWIVMVLVASITLSFFASGCFNDANFAIWGKMKKLIVVGLLMAYILGTGLFCNQLLNNHVKITETSVTVRRGGADTVYGLDEIASYRIYCRSEALEMELRFKDGKTATMFGDASEETDAWREKYYGDANYAAYLVEYLTQRGIQGTLEDQARIENIMSGYDAELKKGFQEIVEMIGAHGDNTVN